MTAAKGKGPNPVFNFTSRKNNVTSMILSAWQYLDDVNSSDDEEGIKRIGLMIKKIIRIDNDDVDTYNDNDDDHDDDDDDDHLAKSSESRRFVFLAKYTMLGQLAYLLCFVTLTRTASPFSTTPASTVPIKLDIQPALVGQDEARFLTVSCNLDASLTSMEKVTALTIYGPKPYGTADQMDPLASVDLWTSEPQLFDDLQASDVKVFGNLGSGNDSHSRLIFSWMCPTNSLSERYRCVANGLTKDGQAVTIESVEETESAIEIGHLHVITESIAKGVVNITNQVNAGDAFLAEKVKELQKAVDTLGNIVKTQNSTIEHLQADISNWAEQWKIAYVMSNFDISQPLSGKTYYVSKTVAPFNIQAADSVCASVLGGYLAEIGTKEEFDFVFKFVKSLGGADNFFTGANDIDEEGVWTYWHSKKPIGFVGWYGNEPNNSGDNEHCMEIRVSENGANDWICDNKAKYICQSSA
ncbi:lectin c [Plakobranchus ocellatus]|uniref:Lectin c n=1 Tax=Plakobranchus ocellatus TaxID=259542 RepID=A0AAV3YIU2_9GAST|nr:lectin c [Plakobranchus ocellatus]